MRGSRRFNPALAVLMEQEMEQLIGKTPSMSGGAQLISLGQEDVSTSVSEPNSVLSAHSRAAARKCQIKSQGGRAEIPPSTDRKRQKKNRYRSCRES